MAANNLGTAYIKIAPQMQGIQKSISDGLASIKSTSLPGAAALGTVIAKGVSAAMNLVTGSIDKAIERTDIINNFPKVMSNMNIGAEAAQKSIEKLKEKLDGLPTSLQAGASAVQRFTSKNSDIEKSTDLFLALNNAILAGGAPAEMQATAIEQMSQAYAKGKPDMMEWRSIQSAMPAQLRQISIAMGYGADGVATLGEALRKGEVSMDDFMDTIVKLNKQGSNGFKSFEEQARNSTDGIGTALTNVQNRAAAAIQKVIQAFGSKDISDAINKFSGSFGKVADWIANNIVPIIKNTLIPILKNMLTAVKNIVEFIAQNKWVQNVLIGIFNALVAYKGLKVVSGILGTITSGIASIGKTAASHVGNIATFISKFIEAKSAGLSLGESLQWVNMHTTGLGQTLTNTHGAIGGFTSKLLGAASAVGAVTLAVEGVNALIKINEIQTTEATTAMRNYENQHYSLAAATRGAQLAQSQLADEINKLKTAEEAATNAEIAAIQARQQQAEYQRQMNDLKAQGKEGTDEYRLAELNLTKALAEEKRANEELAEAQKTVADSKTTIDDLNSSQLFRGDKVLAMIQRENHEYGNMAAQLDELATKTIRYRDENGNMVEASKEKMEEFVSGLADSLMQGDETWRAIVEKANEEGISFSEACAKYGAEGGENLIGNFSQNARNYMPLVTEVGDQTVENIRTTLENLKTTGNTSGKTFMQQMAEGINSAKNLVEAASKSVAQGASDSAKSISTYDVGKWLTQGIANGIDDPNAKGSIFTRIANTVKGAIARAKQAAQEHSPSKATAEIGKYLSLGLAKGINDYAEDAIDAAGAMTERTIDAMNQNGAFGLEGNMTQVQPQTGDTSGMSASHGQVIQYNDFTVSSELDVKEISKRLGWQVATAL